MPTKKEEYTQDDNQRGDVGSERPSLSLDKKILFSSTAILIGVVVSVGISELLIRYLDHVRIEKSRYGIYIENPRGTGSIRLKPNYEKTVLVEGFPAEIRINSKGMPWREVEYEKPSGSERIAFVGDSFTFGMWTSSIHNNFVGVFDSLMSETNYETLNFGVPSYALDDMELIIKEEVTQYDPDYVLIMFYNGNDILGTHLGMERHILVDGVAELNQDVLIEKVPEEHLPAGLRARGRSEVDDDPDDDVSLITRLKRILRTHSALGRRISLWRNRDNSVDAGLEEYFTEYLPDSNRNDQFRNYQFWSRKEYPQVAVDATNLTLEFFERIDEHLKDNGAQLLIAAIPYREQVYVENPVGAWYDVRFPQAHVEAFAIEHQIPYLDLLAPLREYARQVDKPVYYRSDTHLNEEGHRFVGETLHEWFRNVVRSYGDGGEKGRLSSEVSPES